MLGLGAEWRGVAFVIAVNIDLRAGRILDELPRLLFLSVALVDKLGENRPRVAVVNDDRFVQNPIEMGSPAAGHNDGRLGQSRGLASFYGLFGRAVVNIGPEHTYRANLPSLVVLALRAVPRTNAKEDIALSLLGSILLACDCQGKCVRKALPLSRLVLHANQPVFNAFVIDLALFLAALCP